MPGRLGWRPGALKRSRAASPGNPFVTPPDLSPDAEDLPEGVTLADLLEQ